MDGSSAVVIFFAPFVPFRLRQAYGATGFAAILFSLSSLGVFASLREIFSYLAGASNP
jgi:hypothetical protein